jgi:hypothetical protein
MCYKPGISSIAAVFASIYEATIAAFLELEQVSKAIIVDKISNFDTLQAILGIQRMNPRLLVSTQKAD